jgi:hypothetical protein
MNGCRKERVAVAIEILQGVWNDELTDAGTVEELQGDKDMVHRMRDNAVTIDEAISLLEQIK